MKKIFWSMVQDEEGASMVEYGLLVALIAVVSITVLGTLGGGIASMFGDVNAEVNPS